MRQKPLGAVDKYRIRKRVCTTFTLNAIIELLLVLDVQYRAGEV